MVKEIGITFKFDGAAEAIQFMNKLGTASAGLHKEIGSNTPQSISHMKNLATSAHSMAKSVQSSMRMATAATMAFLTGKAFSGIANWVKGSPEADQWKDYMRQGGANDAAFRVYGDHFRELRRKMPGITGGDYYKSAWAMQSSLGADRPDLVKKGSETAAYLKQAMGPEATMDQASEMLRTFTGTFGVGKSGDQLAPMMEKFTAQMQAAIHGTEAKYRDITLGMTHIAGLYAQAGKSPAEAIATLSMASPAFHERSGEIVRALMSKEGEGYAKVMTAVGKEALMARWGKTSEQQLSPEQKESLHKSEKFTKDQAERDAMRMSDAERMRSLEGAMNIGQKFKTQRGFDLNRVLTEAYGEGAAQGLPTFLRAYNSGKLPNLIKDLEGRQFGTMRSEMEQTFQSMDAKFKIFTQRIEDFGHAVRTAFQGIVTDRFEKLGPVFDKMADSWAKNSPKILENVRIFVAEFEAAFGQAFGQLPDIDGKIRNLASALADPKPEKWQELGQYFGQLAGTKLENITSAISDISEGINQLMPSVRELAGYLKSIRQMASAVNEWDKKNSPVAVGENIRNWLGWLTKGIGNADPLAAIHGRSQEQKPGEVIAAPQKTSALPEMVARPPRPTIGVGDLSQLGGLGGQPPPSFFQPPEVTVNTTPTITLDGKEIAANVTDQVEANLQQRADRNLNTAGSFSGMMAK